MDRFWNNIYDDSKDRRYATLFVTTCLFVIGLLSLIIVPATEIFANMRDVVSGYPSEIPVISLFVLASLLLSAAVILRRARKSRGGHFKYSRLSRDELLKARLKLKRQMQPVRFRALQRTQKPLLLKAPDIDLKY